MAIEFMKQYNSFRFIGYKFNPKTLEISLTYGFDDEHEFTEVLTLPQPVGNYDLKAMDRALHALHMIAGISYYKAYCPNAMTLETGPLSAEQAAFWTTVYTKGLGEYFYQNKIQCKDIINFPVDTKFVAFESRPLASLPKNYKALAAIGGGKDSMVTIEQIRNEGADIMLWRVKQHAAIDRIAEIAELPILNIKRQLDPLLFKLNEEGAYNGHVPITLFNICLSYVCAVAYGYQAVVFSNERSANIGNVDWCGMKINHQWSKSDECEQLLRSYMAKFVTSDIHYLNPLRDLSEFAITKRFIALETYTDICTSCNKNWKIYEKPSETPWCGDCPKCAFVYNQYAAFLPKDRLVKIFGTDLYNSYALLPEFKALLGQEGYKPFECVGVPDEVQLAFYYAHKRGDLEDTLAMQYFVNEVLPRMEDVESLEKKVLK
jgi:hypothetical protein